MTTLNGMNQRRDMKKKKNIKKASYEAKFKKYKQGLRDKSASKKHTP